MKIFQNIELGKKFLRILPEDDFRIV